MSKPVIVCVDDEKFVLDTLRTTLTQAFGEDYLIEIAEDGADALELVRDLLANGQEVPVVISDYVMPRMRGDELLRHIQIISQKTLKIMLTGQANIEGVTNAVNEADLYRFISKPWSSSQLVQIVQKAVREYFVEKEKEDRSRALLEVTPDLVLFVRRDGLVLEYRRSIDQGGEPDEYAGKRLGDIFPQEIAAMFSEHIRALPPRNGCVSFEYNLASGPRHRHFETRLTSCGEEAVLAVVRDVSPSKEIESALRAAIVEAEQANRAKSSFLAAMSHEIRTPLNAVVGFSSLMMDTPLNPEQREFADAIHKSADTLLSVVNDILDFSKIEAGRIDLEKISFALREVVGDCLEIAAPEADRKGLEICSLIDEKCPERVIGDVTRIRQVLTNLLGNAVKFTEQGKVDVSVDVLEPAGPAGVRVRFRVRDTGIGMSEEQQKIVFEPFIQADASTTRRFGGTGLGLAISGRLIELMGGSLSVASRQGEGSTFSFTIPLELDTSTSAGPHQPDGQLPLRSAGVDDNTASLSDSGPQPDSADQSSDPTVNIAATEPLRILLAEDNISNQKLLTLVLGRLGYQVDIASNGNEVLEALRVHPYDVILMDVQMPEIDGFQATRLIRTGFPAELQPTIIALTAHASEDDRALCMDAGMDGYLTKPLRRSLLVDALHQAYERRSSRLAG
jgi:signal transduction histidine kinase/ActR/RegA family two-component response regulator